MDPRILDIKDFGSFLCLKITYKDVSSSDDQQRQKLINENIENHDNSTKISSDLKRQHTMNVTLSQLICNELMGDLKIDKSKLGTRTTIKAATT